MQRQQHKKYRTQLEAIISRATTTAQAVSDQVQTGSGDGGNLSTTPLHLGDLGTDEFLREMNATLLENERFLLGEAREALKRLDSGAYGDCQRCGRPIAAERLTAMPYARYCVKCAEIESAVLEVNLNSGRPSGPNDTIAPEGEMDEDRRPRRRVAMDARDRSEPDPDIHATGAAGGGTALGGLAGSNIGHGDPTISQLQDATGSSNFDAEDDRIENEIPTAGRSGGAVGGTPARKRSTGTQ
jgi:RNA polymerase-binding transcription factor DksA